MKKIFFLLLLITSCYAIQNIGLEEEGYFIKANNYVLKLPPALKDPAIINNMYKVQLVPSITTGDGKSISFLPVVKEELIRGLKNRYSFEFEDKKEGIDLWQRIDLTDDYISTTARVTNTESNEQKVVISFNIMGVGKNQIFFPSAVSKKAENYLIFTEENKRGSSLGVKTNFNLPKESEPVLIQNNYGVIANFNLKKGETGSITVYYYPFYIQKEKMQFPISYYSYLFEKSINTIGNIKFSKTNTTTDKIAALLSLIKNEKKRSDGSFNLIHKVDLTTEKDSLGMSAYFKKMCKEVKMPCKLMIGKEDSKKYAWIRAYFNGWQDVDVFRGTKTSPEASIIFEEPASKTILLKGDTEEDFYNATSWVKGIGKSNWLIYSIILLLSASGVIAFLQFKAGSIEKKMKKTELIKEKINGYYNIIKEGKTGDEFTNEVFEKIKEKKGEINLDELSEEMNYSKNLISYAIDYLRDEGFIKIKEKEKKESEEKEGKFSINKKTIGAIAILILTIILIFLLIK